MRLFLVSVNPVNPQEVALLKYWITEWQGCHEVTVMPPIQALYPVTGFVLFWFAFFLGGRKGEGRHGLFSLTLKQMILYL